MSTVFIYSLSDPVTKNIVYVGKSINPQARFHSHLRSGHKNTEIREWVLSLSNQNLLPIMEILDEVPEDDYRFWETYWICQIRSWGFELKNRGYSGVHKRQRNHSLKVLARRNYSNGWSSYLNTIRKSNNI